MKKQVLPQLWSTAKEADFSAQMFGIAAMVDKVSNVADLLVLVSDGSDLFGDSENDMKIVCLENFGMFVFQPKRHARVIGTWDNGGRRSCYSRAARNYSSHSARDDRRELRWRHTSIAVMTRRWAVESDPSCC